jgi:hypothetical protein
MGEVVNLRIARKRKARAEREETAAENRAKFGRSRAEKQKTVAEDALSARRHEAHRIEGTEGRGAGVDREAATDRKDRGACSPRDIVRSGDEPASR